jgi:competence protein ComEC
MLADTGNPVADDRDAKRIFQATQAAGLKQIDYLLTTHFDGDHVGGAPALAKLIPIARFLDHGDSIQADTPGGLKLWQGYQAIAAGKRTIMKAGQRIPLKGLRVDVVSSNGEVINAAINGGKPNPLCRDAQNKQEDTTENNLSLGFLLSYGDFRFLDLGDLTWSKEMELACPVNQLGQVTLYQASHHGFFADRSGAPAHLYAIQPQVVVVNNGPRKGLTTPALYERIVKIPGIEGIWQGHLTLENDKDHNTDERMIANLEPTAECKGNWIRVVVQANGVFTITNGRNNFSRTYQALPR